MFSLISKKVMLNMLISLLRNRLRLMLIGRGEIS